MLHRSVSICFPVRMLSPSHMGTVICVSADVFFADTCLSTCCRDAISVYKSTWMSVNMTV